jgi:hypothetical protein
VEARAPIARSSVVTESGMVALASTPWGSCEIAHDGHWEPTGSTILTLPNRTPVRGSDPVDGLIAKLPADGWDLVLTQVNALSPHDILASELRCIGDTQRRARANPYLTLSTSRARSHANLAKVRVTGTVLGLMEAVGCPDFSGVA